MENTQPGQNKTIMIVLVLLCFILLGVYVIFQLYNNPAKPTGSVSPTPTAMSFPTPTLVPANQVPTQIPLSQAAQLQTQADKNWVQDTLTREAQYFWLDKLPLQTDNYFVYFDTETKKIVAKIYNKTGDQQTIKNEIISNLKEIGVELDKYEILWK